LNREGCINEKGLYTEEAGEHLAGKNARKEGSKIVKEMYFLG